MVQFILNDTEVRTELPPGTALLDFIRYHKNLKGTKIGCREGDCGACTVLVGKPEQGRLHYRTATSCLMPLGNAEGKHIVTVEGINFENGLNPIQQAISDEGATQCGFCTPGFVMSLAGHCLGSNAPTEKNAVASMDGNICRCTGYKSLERAAIRVNDLVKNRTADAAGFAAAKHILPEYFSSVEKRLRSMKDSAATHVARNGEAGAPVTFTSGGTDLYVQRHDAMTHANMDFLFDAGLLNGIAKEGNRCIVGASTTVTDLAESEIVTKGFPGFLNYAKLVSSMPIRNMATLAGNFVNASPIGDFTVFFLALDAMLILSDGDKRRKVMLKNFYKGYKLLDKRPEEFVQEIHIELPDAGTQFNFEKVSKRTHLDIASVNTAMRIKTDKNKITDAGISAGGVAPVPLYLSKASGFLTGKTISREVVIETIAVAQSEISPISDVRGTEAYKRLLLAQLIKSHFIKLFPEHVSAWEIINA